MASPRVMIGKTLRNQTPVLDKFGMPVRAGSAASSRRPSDLAQQVVFGIFVALAIGVTLLQKLGYGSSPEKVVPLVVVIALVAMAVGIVFAKARFRPWRVALYLLFLIVSALTTVIFVADYSPTSLAFYAVLYLPLIVAFETSERTYRRCMRFYSNLSLVIVAIVVAQHLVQLTVGWRYWPNLDTLLPSTVLIPNFNYIQPIVWGMPYMKPNAIGFLEVSYLSQYLAMALIVEIVLFQRAWRMMAFAAAILSTFAGTGPLLLLVTAPVLVGTTRLRNNVIGVAALLAVGLIASELGWFDLIAHRLNEFQHNGTSANMRFVEPLNRIVQAIAQPEGVYSGIGPGMIEKAANFQWWPITKAVVEYGLIAGLLFYLFFTVALFDAPPNVRIAICVFVWFTFEGSLLTAINPISCVMFSTMFLIDRSEVRRRRRQEPPAVTPPAQMQATG